MENFLGDSQRKKMQRLLLIKKLMLLGFFSQILSADVTPTSVNTAAGVNVDIGQYLNKAVFTQLNNYGKCSLISIANHASFDNKAVPFYIFSDSIGDSAILKTSASDGSGNSVVMDVQGKFDKALSLDVDVEDFPGQDPIIKYGISAAARVDSFQNVSSMWKSSAINPNTKAFDPAIFGNYVYNKPAQGRIFTKASKILSIVPYQGVDLNNYSVPLVASQWRTVNANETYQFPNRSPKARMTGLLPNPTDWFEILSYGRALAGEPLVVNNSVIAKNAFGVQGVYYKTNYLFKLNVDDTKYNIGSGDMAWAWWAYQVQPATQGFTANFNTGTTAYLDDICTAFILGRFWYDADHTRASVISNPKGQSILGIAKFAKGFVVMTSQTTYLLMNKPNLGDGVFLDDFATSGIDIGTQLGGLDKMKSFTKVVAGYDSTSNNIYLAFKKIDKTFVVYQLKISGTTATLVDSVPVNVGILDLAMDNKGRLAVVDAINSQVWWANVPAIIAQKAFYTSAVVSDPLAEQKALVQYISDQLQNVYKPLIDDAAAHVRFLQQDMTSILAILSNNQTSPAEWNNNWQKYLLDDAAMVNYMSALERYIDDCENHLDYLQILKNTGTLDDSLRALIDTATTFQANITTQRNFTLQVTTDLLNRYDGLYVIKKASFLAAINALPKSDLPTFEAAVSDFYTFVSQMNSRKNAIFVRLSGYLSVLYTRKARATQNLAKLTGQTPPITSGAVFDAANANLSLVNNTISGVKAVINLRTKSATNMGDIGNTFLQALKQVYDINDSTTAPVSFLKKALFDTAAAADKSIGIAGINLIAKQFLSLSSSAEQYFSDAKNLINSFVFDYNTRVVVENEDADLTASTTAFINQITTLLNTFTDITKDNNPSNPSTNLANYRNTLVNDLTGIGSNLNQQVVQATSSLSTLLGNMGPGYQTTGANLNTQIQTLNTTLSGWQELVSYAGSRTPALKEQAKTASSAIAAAQQALVGVTTTALQDVSAELEILNSNAANFDLTTATSAKDLMNRFKFISDIKDQIISKLSSDVQTLATSLNNLKADCDNKVNALNTSFKNMLVGILDPRQVPANLANQVQAAIASGAQDQMVAAIKSIIAAQNAQVTNLGADRDYWKNLAAQYQADANKNNDLLRIANTVNQNLQNQYSVDTAALKGQITTLQSQLADAQKQGASQAEVITQLTQQIASLTASYNDKIATLTAINNDLQAENQRMQSQIASLNQQAATLAQEREDLQNRLNQANITIQQKNDLIAQLQNVNQKYSAALQKEQDYSAQLLADLNSTKDSLRASQAILLQTQQDLQNTTLARDALKADLDALAKEKIRIDNLNAALIANLQDINKRLQNSLDVLENQVDVLSDVIDQNLDLTVFKNIDQKVITLQNQLQSMQSSDPNYSSTQAALTDALAKQKNKNDLMAMMGLGSEEANLLNALIEGQTLSSSQLDPYKLDWVLLDYSQINSMLKDLTLTLSGVALTMEKNTPGSSVAAGIDVNSLMQTTPDIEYIGKVLLAYDAVTSLQTKPEGVTTPITLSAAYANQVSDEDKARISSVLSQQEIQTILNTTPDNQFKSKIASIFTSKLFGPAGPANTIKLQNWDPTKPIISQAAKLNTVSDSIKASFLNQIARYLNTDARQSIPYYKTEMIGIFSGDEKSINATVAKAKLNILIKLKNADATLQQQNYNNTIQGLQAKAMQQQQDLAAAIAAGEKTLAEAQAESLKIEQEKNAKIASQQSTIAKISKALQAGQSSIAASKATTLKRQAKNQREQMIINYYMARSAELASKIATVNQLVGTGILDASILQSMVDEQKRLEIWFDFVMSVPAIAENLTSDGQNLKKYEISIDSRNNIVVSNQDEIGKKEEVLLCWENSIEGAKYYLSAENLLNGLSFENLSKNRFATLENMAKSNQKVFVVNQSDNLFTLEVSIDGNRYRISLLPKTRSFDLVSGIVGNSPEVNAIRTQVEQMQKQLEATLSKYKDYDVVVLPIDQFKIADGSIIILKQSASGATGSYDQFVGVQAINTQSLIQATPVSLMPVTLNNPSIHYVLKEQSNGKYQLLDATGSYKLISQNNQLWQVDANAVYFNTKTNITLTLNDYNNATDKSNIVRLNDQFTISGTRSNVNVIDENGLYLRITNVQDSQGQQIDSLTFQSSAPSPTDKVLSLMLDEDLFYLESEASPANPDSVIIRTFSTQPNMDMHGYLSMKVTSSTDSTQIGLAYKPWISAEVHAKAGMKETVFSLLRYTMPNDLTNQFTSHLQSLSNLDSVSIVNSTKGFTARDEALSELLKNITQSTISARTDQYIFGNYISLIYDLFNYKLSKGTLQGKDAAQIKEFVTKTILPNVNQDNVIPGSATENILKGAASGDKSTRVGGLLNISESTSSSTFASNDIITLKFGNLSLGVTANETNPASVSLVNRNRMNSSINFVLQGDATQGFMMLDLNLKNKLAIDSNNNLVLVPVEKTDVADYFKFSGDTLDKISVTSPDGKLILAQNTTTNNGSLQMGTTPFIFSSLKASPNSLEAELFAMKGQPSVTVNGVTKTLKQIVMNALTSDQSKMNQNLLTIQDYLANEVNQNSLSIWFNPVQDLLFASDGILANTATKTADANLITNLGNIVKSFAPNPNDFYVMSNELSDTIGTITALNSETLINISGAQKALQIVPLKFLDNKDEKGRNTLVRFLPTQQKGVYAIAIYSLGLNDPSYLRVVTPLFATYNNNRSQFSLVLGDLCTYDKDKTVTNNPSQLFEVRGNTTSITLRSLATDQGFTNNTGYIVGQVSGSGQSKFLIANTTQNANGFDNSESTKPFANRTADPIIKLRLVDNIEKDIFMADAVTKYAVIFYMNLLAVVNDTSIDAATKTARADVIVKFFRDYITTSNPDGSLAYKDLLVVRGFNKITTDENAGTYSLFDILSLINERLTYKVLEGVGIKWSNDARKILDSLMALANPAKNVQQQTVTTTASMASGLDTVMNPGNKDLAFVVNTFLWNNDNAGLANYIQSLLQYIFNTTDLVVDPANYNVSGLSVMMPRADLTFKNINDLVDRLKRLSVTAFVLSPNHPLINLVRVLVAKFSSPTVSTTSTPTTVQPTGYAGMTVTDRLSLAEAMINGGRYRDLNGKIKNNIDKAEATKILATISDSDLAQQDDPTGYKKWKDDLIAKLTAKPKTAPIISPQQLPPSFGITGVQPLVV